MRSATQSLRTNKGQPIAFRTETNNAGFESTANQKSNYLVAPHLPWEAKGAQYSWLGKTTLNETEATERIFGEERFRRLVHHSTDLICVLEADGFIKYASASAFDILGFNSDALAGTFLHELLPTYTSEDITAFLKMPPPPGTLTEITIPGINGRQIDLEFSCADMSSDPVIRGYVFNARDITSRRLTEAKLKYQARLLSNIRESVIGLGLDQKITYLNAAAEKMLRVQTQDAAGMHWSNLLSAKWELPEEGEFFKEAMRERGVWLGEVTLQVANGRTIHAEVSVTMHKEHTENPGILIVIRDIRDRKVVENVLHESVTKFRNLVNVTSDLVLQLDEAGRIVSISPKVESLLGYTQQSLNGTYLGKLLTESKAGHENDERLTALLTSQQPFTFEQFTFSTEAGAERVFEFSALPLQNHAATFIGYQAVIRDITQRIADEKSIRQSLKEKETLIKEIHHRVKNNMQIVSSLLYLQTQFIKDPDMLARLRESQDRIRSMALVHEKLYQSADLDRIDFKDYLETLSRHIANSYRNRLIFLALELDDEETHISIDMAIPCGLIVNELVSNAYKHAFDDGQKGVVTVKMKAAKGTAQLVIEDNGRGIACTEISKYEETSLGMQLVGALIQQIAGKLEVTVNEGTCFTLSFKM